MGILLNLNFWAVVLVPALLIVILEVRILSLLLDCGQALKELRAAISNNTLDQLKNDTPTTDEGTELHTIHNEPDPQGIRATGGEGSPSGDTMTETPAANAGSESSREMSEHRYQSTQGHDSTVSQIALQGQQVADDGDDENQAFVPPTRQDTESGLRGQSFSAARVSEPENSRQ